MGTMKASIGKAMGVFLIALACSMWVHAGEGVKYEPTWESLDSRPTPAWFLDAKFGVFIHWGVYAVPSWGPKGQYAENYAHWLYNAKRQEERDFHARVYGEDFEYKEFAPMFKAELFEPAQWADTFARSGARYVVLTSKHTDTFCLWPAPDSANWNSVEAGPKRDLCGELTEAVCARGLKMGFYYCLLEWHNPYSTLYKDDLDAYVETRMLPQLKDLVTRYKPSIVWADGEWDHPDTTWRSREFLAWLFNEGPNPAEVAVNDRWGKECRHKHGGYYTTEYATGLEQTAGAWEECRGMAHSFGYSRNESLADYRSARELILMLVDLVSRGGNLLLDIGPTADGRIPVIMEERLVQMGEWLEVNGEAIHGTRPWRESCQWSAGERPDVKHDTSYLADYDIGAMAGEAGDGQAVIEAFFTSKDGAVYAITPRWPGKTLVLNVSPSSDDAAVTMLGREGLLPWRRQNGKIAIDLSEIDAFELPCRWAHAFKVR